MTQPITISWQTVATVAFSGTVNEWIEDRRAHGGLCKLQVCRGMDGIRGRRVNVNGRYTEVGPEFPMDASTLKEWRSLSA